MAGRPSAPNLLSLPADVLEQVLGLTPALDDDGFPIVRFPRAAPGQAVTWGLLPQGALSNALLACKGLYAVGRSALHSSARVAFAGNHWQVLAPAAAYIEPLQQHRGTLRHLTLDARGPNWPAGASIAACMAAADPARLRGLVISASSSTFAEVQMQLPAFSALDSLHLFVGHEGSRAALPPSLRRLSMNCDKVDAGLRARLAPLTRLHTLCLGGCCAVDPGVQLPAVHTLRLSVGSSSQGLEELSLPAFTAADVCIEGPWPLLRGENRPSCLLVGSGELLGASGGQLTHLVLREWVLEEPPAALGCTGLRVLELGQCNHHWLKPATLRQLPGLTRLSLQTSLQAASDFGCLPQLQELCLAAEGLEELPASVAGLRCLRVLDLTGNRLTDLPSGPYVHSLRSLSLAHNRFERLPRALTEATALEALDVTGCRLLGANERALSVLRELPRLRTVHFMLDIMLGDEQLEEESRAALQAELLRLRGAMKISFALHQVLDPGRRGSAAAAAVDTSRGLNAFWLQYFEGEDE